MLYLEHGVRCRYGREKGVVGRQSLWSGGGAKEWA